MCNRILIKFPVHNYINLNNLQGGINSYIQDAGSSYILENSFSVEAVLFCCHDKVVGVVFVVDYVL